MAHFSGRILIRELRTYKGARAGLKSDLLQTNSNVTRALSLALLYPILPFISVPLRHRCLYPKDAQGNDKHLAKYIEARNIANGGIIEHYRKAQDSVSGKHAKKKGPSGTYTSKIILL